MTLLFTRLPLDNVRNCRDLGGIPTVDKKAIRWKKFIRSGNINRASSDDIAFLKDYGVKHIIDLRTLGDINQDTQLKEKFNYFTIHNINLFGKERIESDEKKTDLVTVETSEKLIGLYRLYLSNHREIKLIFDFFLKYPNDTFLFHCGIGKDRTGIISLLILGLAGVHITDILANYEVSKTFLRNDLFGEMSYGFDYEVLNSEANNILYAYNLVMKEYGGFINFFKLLGYKADEIFRLNSLIVDEGK